MKTNKTSVPFLFLSIFLTLVCAVGCKKSKLTQGPPPSPTPDYIPGRFELGVNIHTNDTSQVGLMKEMGAKWVRIDAEWCHLESEPGVLDFTVVDRAVDNAKKHGLQVYTHIQCTPEFALEPGQKPWTGVPKLKYWTNFVEAFVKHFRGRVSAVGIWNEPNLSVFWTGSARDYAERLLKPAAPIIRREGPGMLVVAADLAHLYSGTIGMQEFYETLKQTGAIDQIDVVAHHVYGYEDFDYNLDGHPGITNKKGFREILDDAGIVGKRIWITEFGVDSRRVGEQLQSEYIYRQIQKMSNDGYIEKAFIYEIWDGDPTTGASLGVLRNDGSPKPVFQMLKDIFNP